MGFVTEADIVRLNDTSGIGTNNTVNATKRIEKNAVVFSGPINITQHSRMRTENPSLISRW